jgi:hypothetical protein
MWYSFIAAEIQEYADDKEETYAQRDNWESLLAMISPVSELLQPQIRFLYGLLDSDDKSHSIQATERKRKQIGPQMARTSEIYANYLTSLVIDNIMVAKSLTKRALDNWDAFNANVFPYNPQTKKILRFCTRISLTEGQNVFCVVDPDTDIKWVLKWDSENYTEPENPEAAAYVKLKALGAQCPMLQEGFFLLNTAVLVMEFLQPLDVTDNAIDVGRQLLTTQLKYIHTFGCYFDLKLDNIRKRISLDAPLYFLIDMDLDIEPQKGGGFKRSHYTAYWTSQSMPTGLTGFYTQLSSYRNDLTELCYVIHQLIAHQAYKSRFDIFSEKLQNDAKHLATFGLKPGDNLADSMSMADDKDLRATARGWRVIRRLLEFPMSLATARITCGYMQLVERLPLEPPANIHDRLAQSLDMDRYMDMRTRMAPKEVIECRICSYIGAAYRCGDCYHETTFLCSQACGKQHKCK